MTYNAKNYEAQGGEQWIVGGEIDVITGGVLKIAGANKTAALAAAVATPVSGVAAGYKVARGAAADVTGTEEITSGLATVISVSVTLAEDPDLAEANLVSASIPAQTGTDAGKFTIKTWKPTAADNATPVAGTGNKLVAWIAVGT